MASAALLARGFCRRKFAVTCGDRTHIVEYSPWGLNTEYVYVDGAEAIRRRHGDRMSHGYRFRLGRGHVATLLVAVPLLGEFVLCRSFNYVCLMIDGEVVYQEGRSPGSLPMTDDVQAERPRGAPRHAFDW